VIPIVGAGIVLVRRNIRMGRGDRRGSFRIALFTFGTLTLAHGFRADHTSVGAREYALLIHVVSQGCYAALAVWSFYMALEPAVRRRWPHTLISWNRLLGGRFRDPLVARDVLAGVVLGLGVTLSSQLGVEAPSWFGRAPSLGSLAVLTTLNSPRHVAYFFLLGACLGIVYSLSLLFNLYLVHALVRRAWLARAVVFSFVFLTAFAGTADPLVGVPLSAIFAGLFMAALTRFGLLSSAVTLFTFLVTIRAPLTFDWSAWYAGRSYALLGFFTLLLLAASYTSLGGKPLFGKALLED
jgi:serine/threonine-protein kinase